MAFITPKKWLLLSIVAAICVIVAFAAPRLQRSIAYQRRVSEPSVSRKLAIELASTEPAAAANAEVIEANYATFKVPVGVFADLQAHETWLLLNGSSNAEVLLTEVGYPTELSVDGNFTFYHDAINTRPATQWQVFTMSESDFAAHLTLVIGKAATPYADNRVTYFETSTTKGFMRHGSQHAFPDVINIAVWDKERPIAQEITVTIADPTIRQQVADSYQFNLEEVPDRHTLLELVKKAANTFQPNAG